MCRCHVGIPAVEALGLMSRIEGSAIYRCQDCQTHWELIQNSAWVQMTKY